MEDIRLEKCLEAIYDEIITQVPAQKRKSCPVVIKLASMLDTMKHENNAQIAADMGIVGDCKGCGKRCD
jgi:hypothetical protein